MSVKLVWITPQAEKLIVDMARVSNPASQAAGENNERLIQYLINHKHWSPFEMASACFEINTTRDIAHQILRHRSFSFQEFSQRYTDVSKLGENVEPVYSDIRMQDTKNRQNSIASTDKELANYWKGMQSIAYRDAMQAYFHALELGIAKELARKVLPEGLTRTRLYMAGTIRSWIHYCDIRTAIETQQEHREIALVIAMALREELPNIWST